MCESDSEKVGISAIRGLYRYILSIFLFIIMKNNKKIVHKDNS